MSLAFNKLPWYKEGELSLCYVPKEEREDVIFARNQYREFAQKRQLTPGSTYVVRSGFVIPPQEGSKKGVMVSMQLPSNGNILKQVYIEYFVRKTKLDRESIRKHNGFKEIVRLFLDRKYVYRINLVDTTPDRVKLVLHNEFTFKAPLVSDQLKRVFEVFDPDLILSRLVAVLRKCRIATSFKLPQSRTAKLELARKINAWYREKVPKLKDIKTATQTHYGFLRDLAK